MTIKLLLALIKHAVGLNRNGDGTKRETNVGEYFPKCWQASPPPPVPHPTVVWNYHWIAFN